MTRNKAKSNRVSKKTIVAFVRGLIVRGDLNPGDRLPTQEEVTRKFGASSLTVKRAFRELTAQGFSRSAPKIGRFVPDRPPHLTRYALVFFGGPDEQPQSWSRFDMAIDQASRRVAAQRRIALPHYYNVNGHPDSEGYQSLMRDIDNQRLAGVIFTFSPHLLQATPLMERTDPPRVNSEPTHGSVGSVSRVLDERHFIYRALDVLHADGRRRFAVITKPEGNPGFPDEFEAAVASRGGMTRPFWTQAVEPRHTRWVRHAVRAILGEDRERLPDAMLVTDDHLVEPVAEALTEFGIRVPQDMRVVGHWNFPLPYRGRLPIDLLGYDACELVRTWVDAIDAQRRGEPVQPYTTIPARFAWELAGDNQQNQQSSAGDPAVTCSISTGSVFEKQE